MENIKRMPKQKSHSGSKKRFKVTKSGNVKFARAKGLSEFKVIFKHALRNAINPMITLLGFEFAGLLSGAALTEYVFQYGHARFLL